MPLSKEAREFHMAEFSKLNGEIAELIKSASQLFTFAVASSGALFAWLIIKAVPHPLKELGFAIPPLLSAVLAVMAYAQAARIKQMGRYLRKLEAALGSSGLGWEEQFKHENSVVGIATMTAWIILIAANIAGAAVAIHCTR